MDIALISDTHIGARNDSPAFNKHFLKLGLRFIKHLKSSNIKHVFHLGDVFDKRRSINIQTFKNWKDLFFDPLQELGVSLHIICGNHDVYYRNTNTVNSLSVLLKDYPNITIYESEATEVSIGDKKILLVPWLNQSNTEKSVDLIKNTDASICFGHFDIIGFEMQKGMVNTTHGLDKHLFCDFDLVCSGHYHTKSSIDNIHYLGSPYQIIASDYNDPRGYHILNLTSNELKFIENLHTMFERIIYDDTHTDYMDVIENFDFSVYSGRAVKLIIKEKKNPSVYDMYLDKIMEIEPQSVSIVDQTIVSADDVNQAIETKDTKEVLKQFVSGMNLANEKEVVSLLEEIYTEAISGGV